MEANLRFAGPENDGDAHLRPAVRLAELDLQPPERRRRSGALKVYGTGDKAAVRLEPRLTSSDLQGTPMTHRLQREDSRTTSTSASDRTLQRALEHWQPNFLDWWNDMGPDGSPGLRRLPAHRRQRRPAGLGALRLREDARLPLGHLPGPADAGPQDRLRRPQGRAGLAGSARRVPRQPAPHHRHAGRHRAGVGRAAAPARA